MLSNTNRPAGLLMLTERSARPDAHDWSAAIDSLLPQIRQEPWCHSVARFAVGGSPAVGGPGLGATHVTMLETSVEDASEALTGLLSSWRSDGQLPAHHAIVSMDRLVAHGSHATPPPSDELVGRIVAWVCPADPADGADWDAWVDDVHVPDMVATGAFTAAARWRRPRADSLGANHLSVYDITTMSVADAVEVSASAMPGLAAAGRKRPGHVGGLTLALDRTA